VFPKFETSDVFVKFKANCTWRKKQKYMEVTRKPTNTEMLKFDDQQYERVK